MIWIWWTSQTECEAIGEALPETAPEYLCAQYRSRRGRSGRGRLWVAAHIDLANIVAWPVSPLGLYLGDHCAGIAIGSADAIHLVELPGLITDARVRRIEAMCEWHGCRVPAAMARTELGGGIKGVCTFHALEGKRQGFWRP